MNNNQTEGRYLYRVGDAEARALFERQWVIWPDRADERLTTNISFHYGAIIAYRREFGKEPVLSNNLVPYVAILDKYKGLT
jgi:hypothetical protein